MVFSVIRVGLLSVAVVTSIFAFLSAVSPNYVSMIVFRMVVGFGLGGGPVYSTWFLEFVPVQSRGIWMVIFSTSWTVGTILEASLAWVSLSILLQQPNLDLLSRFFPFTIAFYVLRQHLSILSNCIRPNPPSVRSTL